MALPVINSANDLYISVNDELRPWSDVSQDIIEYLKKKVDAISNAIVYKGSVENKSDLNAINSPKIGDMYNVVNDNNNNYAWNGTEWDSLGPLANIIDEEAIQNSENAIQSGFIYDALMNYVTFEQIQTIINEVFGSDEISNITSNLSQALSDITEDISDINTRLEGIPDPLISTQMNNAIINGIDNGLYVEDNSSALEELQETVNLLKDRVDNLDETAVRDNPITTINSVVINDGIVSVDINSDKIMYYKVSGDVTFDFSVSSNDTEFSEKYLYVEVIDTANLYIENCVWDKIANQPTTYESGTKLLAKVIWIGGNVYIHSFTENIFYS